MCWRDWEKEDRRHSRQARWLMAHGSGVAARQMKIRAFKAKTLWPEIEERRGKKKKKKNQKRGEDQKKWRKTLEPDSSVGWETRYFAPPSLYGGKQGRTGRVWAGDTSSPSDSSPRLLHSSGLTRS